MNTEAIKTAHEAAIAASSRNITTTPPVFAAPANSAVLSQITEPDAIGIRGKFYYTATQLRAYGQACAAAERTAIEAIVRQHGISPNPIDDPHPDAELINGALSAVVDAIRART